MPLSATHRSRLLSWSLAAFVLASRLPYLRPGYGVDPDAYRVLASARVIRAGEYTASRLPGYPLHELLTALLLPGGPRLVNGATAAISALAALALFKLAQGLGLSQVRAVLLALAFAFTPVVFQNSTVSLDYVWSISFALLSAVQIVSGRAWLAGVLLGAAIGSRITAGAMLVPLLVLQQSHAWQGRRLSDAITFTLVTCTTGALCFAPVYAVYGSTLLSYDDNPAAHAPALVLARAGAGVWGSFGLYAWCGITAIALCAHAEVRKALRSARARSLLWTSLSACALFGLAFVVLPHEPGYLIPCVPFALLLVAGLLPTVAIAQLAALLLLSCFVTLDGQGLHAPGPIEADRISRVEQNATTNRAIRAAARLPGKALIVAGPRLPQIEATLGSPQQGAHQYLYLLQSEAELEGYLRRGYALYYVDRAVERRQRRSFGISLREHGARPLL